MNTWDLFSEGNEKPTPHEKFKRGIKSAGYDMDAGAKRLEDLLAKQKAERDAREKEEQKNVSEAQDEVDYDDDYQDMVRRVGEKAKAADALKAQGKQPQTKFNPKTGRYYVDHGQGTEVKENAEELSIGDPVIITGNVEFEGKTGDIDSFGDMKRFVVVNLYNHGKHSFHSSDVSYNDHADIEEAGYGRNRGYTPGVPSPHAPTLGGRGRREDDEYHVPDPVAPTWYIRANGKIIKDKMGAPYQYRDKEVARKAAMTMMSKPFNAGKKFTLTTNPQDDRPENEAVLHTKYKRNRFSGVQQRDQTQDELSNIAMNRVKGVAEGQDDNGISFQVQKGKNKFATTLSIGNKPVGVYQYDADTGRSIAEVYPEFKGKGLGKLLVLHAIYTAAQLGLDFQEDESRTAKYDNVLDSLSSNGYIVDDDGYWYVTGEGEQYLQQSMKQGVAEGSQRVDSLVTDALKIMRGSELNDAVQALKTVLGNREYNDRRGHYSFYVKQLLDMYNQQGVAEGKKPDNYHIVNKDGKPASLASYADRASAEKDRDAKHPGAEVRQVGPRGKVKGVSEERTETKNEKGEVTSWKDESDWRKVSKEKDGRGRVTNLSDKARRETEKLKKEKSVNESQLDEGVVSKIASMALGMALAIGAGSSSAEEMWVYQDANTQKLRIAMSLQKVPADALMSFKVDTDNKTVSMIKGNQETPVQVQPAVVKQAQQQAQSKVEPKAEPKVEPNAEPGIIYKDNNWVAKFSKDAMSDKSSCTIFSNNNRYVQVNVDKTGPTALYVSYTGRGGVQSYKYRVDSNPASETKLPSRSEQDIGVGTIPFKNIQGGKTLTVQAFTILSEIKTDTIDIGSLGNAVNACQKAMSQSIDEFKESINEGWKSALGGAALAGAMALGGNTAHAQPSGEDFLPDIVAHVTFKVNGNTVTKDINLGTAFKSPGEASAALEKFLKAKGIKYFDYSLERVKLKDNNYLEKTPAVDTGHSGSVDSGPYRATGSNNDYMAKESIEEAVDRAAKSMMEDGYEFTEAANPAQQAAIAISMKKAGKKPKTEEKVRLDPKCWTGKKIGNPKTKMKGGVRVNNCVPK